MVPSQNVLVSSKTGFYWAQSVFPSVTTIMDCEAWLKKGLSKRTQSNTYNWLNNIG